MGYEVKRFDPDCVGYQVKWFDQDMLGYQVKLFDPEILGYCGVIRLNGLIQMCRVMLGYHICLLMFSTRF